MELLQPAEAIEHTIVAIGSHDLALDLLGSAIRRIEPRLRLSSANVGSFGGLLALQRGEAHVAGCHLLDEATGEYNWPFIQRLLPNVEVALVHLAYREQGLIVAPGNPKGLRTLEDLLRPDVRFVNRQRGAGTRTLLVFECKKRGLDPAQIQGYDWEEVTHTAVACAVQGGLADVGLGIRAAALALGLDFVPLLSERYDLVVPRTFYEAEWFRPLCQALASPEFRAAVQRLGGYDVSDMGREWPRPTGPSH